MLQCCLPRGNIPRASQKALKAVMVFGLPSRKSAMGMYTNLFKHLENIS